MLPYCTMWGYKSPSTSVPGAASHVIVVAAAAAALPRRRSPGVDAQVRVRRKLGAALLQGRQPAVRHAQHPQLCRRPQRRRHAAVSHNTTASARQLFMCYVLHVSDSLLQHRIAIVQCLLVAACD